MCEELGITRTQYAQFALIVIKHLINYKNFTITVILKNIKAHRWHISNTFPFTSRHSAGGSDKKSCSSIIGNIRAPEEVWFEGHVGASSALFLPDNTRYNQRTFTSIYDTNTKYTIPNSFYHLCHISQHLSTI